MAPPGHDLRQSLTICERKRKVRLTRKWKFTIRHGKDERLSGQYWTLQTIFELRRKNPMILQNKDGMSVKETTG